MTTATNDFLGHPRGLSMLFLTEMWERFSFYGMRALLIFYLTKHFLFDDSYSSGVYGAYLGLTYALPVLGGYVADKYIGSRKAVMYGGILLVLGHLTMAYEGSPAYMEAGNIIRDTLAIDVLFLALSLITVGVGFLKPNISTLVGSLYADNDIRRDSGFTIFYMGINIGAFAATLIVGTIGEKYGWSYGFGLAGFGMLIGLAFFMYGQKFLDGAGDPPKTYEALPKVNILGFNKFPKEEWIIYACSLVAIVICWFLVQDEHTVGFLLFGTVLVAYSYILYRCYSQHTIEDFKRVSAILVLIFFTVAFWAMFEQAGSSMNLFADRVVDRTWDAVGYEFAASIFQSINPGVIILLGPFVAYLWYALDKRNIVLGPAVKFALGIILAGLGFGCLVLGAISVGVDGKVGAFWLVLAYVFHTFGELCLSPVGLSMVTKLSPKSMVGLMMGTWFLASAIADWISAQIAKVAAVDRDILVSGDIQTQLEIYTSLFSSLAIFGVGIGFFLLLISPFVNKLIKSGVDENGNTISELAENRVEK